MIKKYVRPFLNIAEALTMKFQITIITTLTQTLHQETLTLAIPQPVSLTSTRNIFLLFIDRMDNCSVTDRRKIELLVTCTFTDIIPPSGVNLMALDTKLRMTCGSLYLSASIT